jgi:PAS domain S-box-containing protein
MFGYGESEIIGKPLTILMPERFHDAHQAGLARYLSSREAHVIGQVVELAGRRKNGQEFPLELSLSTWDSEGKTFFTAIIRDISKRKQMEEELVKKEVDIRMIRRELADFEKNLIQSERSRALGDISAGVAHQFNNILMVVRGMTELAILNLSDRAKVQEFLQKIKLGTIDGEHIVHRLQEFARRSSSETNQPISVNDSILMSVEITQPKWKDESEKAGISIGVKKDLQEVPPVLGVESEVREVFVNLILNAVDAMPKGGTLSLSSEFQNGKVVIKISDTGTGMSVDTLAKIFEPFFTTKLDRGTGLGLAISLKIITQMGGTIRAESCEGKGSTFTIELPPSPKIPSKEKETTRLYGTSPARILVIDDEVSICEIIQGFLEVRNHKVVACRIPADAMYRLQQEHFDLVITDLGMAPISGWDVLRYVKKIRPSTKTILLTGWGDMLSESEAIARGADLILSKPVDNERLVKMVDRLLSTRSE